MIFDMNAIRYGSFAVFFALDVITKTMQKGLNDELQKENNPEIKARAGVHVVAVDR